MAIIKCPECGHQTSDKAPTCPSCGVEIAGKIEKCHYCGEVYLKSDGVCPHCHKAAKQTNVETTGPATTRQATTKKHGEAPLPKPAQTGQGDKKKNGKATVLIVSTIIAALLLGVFAYVYNSAKNDREAQEYEFAMTSTDPLVLQTYLDNFKDAPQEHIDSIQSHLERLNAQDKEWANAVMSCSKAALTEYLKNHPDSPHRSEAVSMIDSIDWAQCAKVNTAEAYQLYIDEHANGNHYDEAQLALKNIKSTQVSADERQAIVNVFRQFFMSINEKDESNLTAVVSDIVNFLGKTTATKTDIVSFMHKLYKPEVQSLVWSLSKDFSIDKKEIGDGVYEYDVTFMADEKVTKTDDTDATTQYRISAKVDAEGKISDFSMTRFVE